MELKGIRSSKSETCWDAEINLCLKIQDWNFNDFRLGDRKKHTKKRLCVHHKTHNFLETFATPTYSYTVHCRPRKKINTIILQFIPACITHIWEFLLVIHQWDYKFWNFGLWLPRQREVQVSIYSRTHLYTSS